MSRPVTIEQVHPAVHRFMLSSQDLPGDSAPSDAVLRAGEGHVICGDAIDTLSRFPSESVDLVHTSPPYNIDKQYESGRNDRSSVDEYRKFLSAAINELKRVVKPGGSVFWQTGYTQGETNRSEIVPIDLLSYDFFRSGPNDFVLWDRIIWRYWGGHAFTKKFTNKHETVLWFVKGGKEPTFLVDAVRERSKEYDKRNNFWGRNPGNVWEVDRVAYGSTEQTSHIAVFPEEITERIVRACSRPGEIVLDPFSGSGTVAKVARGLGRRWIGVEISPFYAAESCVRVGYQQPSEGESLASELIKHLAFRDRPSTLPISEIVETVSFWSRSVPVVDLWNNLEKDIRRVFSDGRGRNQIKRDVWIKYDKIMGPSSVENSIALADELLSRCYRLRKHFNGVTRYRSVLDALTASLSNLEDSDNATKYICRIAEQEPSSFELHGNNLSLVSATRKVAMSDSDSSVDCENEQPCEGRESEQARLLL